MKVEEVKLEVNVEEEVEVGESHCDVTAAHIGAPGSKHPSAGAHWCRFNAC